MTAPDPVRRSLQHWSVYRSSIMALLLGLIGLIPSTAYARDAIQLTGTDGIAQTWTPAHLKEASPADVKAIEYTLHGEKHTANCIPLVALLKSAGVPVTLKMDPKADPKLKNYSLRLAVVVEGGDGYTATFSVGELLPDIGGKEAWIALDEDGKPLSDRDGLVKLIVPTDQKPARWVRDVASITILDPAKPATRPAN